MFTRSAPAYHLELGIVTHWGRDKMAAKSQTTSSNAFSWMKMYEFLLKISLKFVPRGPINNISTLVQMMAWRRTGDKPLSEAMMIILLTHICVTRPQWVKSVRVCACLCLCVYVSVSDSSHTCNNHPICIQNQRLNANVYNMPHIKCIHFCFVLLWVWYHSCPVRVLPLW